MWLVKRPNFEIEKAFMCIKKKTYVDKDDKLTMKEF
jgi:hypothetical protein